MNISFNKVGLCTACSAVKRIGHANHNQGLASDGVCYECRYKSEVYALVAEVSGLCVSHIKGSDQVGVELAMDSLETINLEMIIEERFSVSIKLDKTTTVDEIIALCE